MKWTKPNEIMLIMLKNKTQARSSEHKMCGWATAMMIASKGWSVNFMQHVRRSILWAVGGAHTHSHTVRFVAWWSVSLAIEWSRQCMKFIHHARVHDSKFFSLFMYLVFFFLSFLSLAYVFIIILILRLVTVFISVVRRVCCVELYLWKTTNS